MKEKIKEFCRLIPVGSIIICIFGILGFEKIYTNIIWICSILCTISVLIFICFNDEDTFNAKDRILTFIDSKSYLYHFLSLFFNIIVNIVLLFAIYKNYALGVFYVAIYFIFIACKIKIVFLKKRQFFI